MVKGPNNIDGVNHVDIFIKTSPPVSWQTVKTGTPYQVFLWNQNGICIDGTISDGVNRPYPWASNTLGFRMADIFPSKAAATVLRGIREVLKTGKSRKIMIRWEKDTVRYQAEFQLIPLQEFVLGVVMDRPRARLCVPRKRSRLVTQVRRITKHPESPFLTKREWEIIRVYRPERTYQQIGDRLGITERTVKFHLTNILHKLHIPSRRHLAALDFTRPPGAKTSFR